MTPYERAEEERHERAAAAFERLSLYSFSQLVDSYILELHEESKTFPKSLKALWMKITPLYEKAQQTHIAMYESLKKDFDLDTNNLAFQAFRGERLAAVFNEFPHMVAELKTRARTQSYNVGYKDTLQLYNMIAKNPDKYIREAENLLARDLNGGVMKCPVGEVTLAETFTAMDFFIEHHNEWICTELPDYKTIPRRSDCVSTPGIRSTRNKQTVTPRMIEDIKEVIRNLIIEKRVDDRKQKQGKGQGQKIWENEESLWSEGSNFSL